MARPLNEVELFFVKENKNIGLEELVNKLPEVDANEIAALLSHLRETHTKTKTEEVNSLNDFNAGNLMARQEGVVVMTPAAAELSDARRVLHTPAQKNYAKNNEKIIHTIKNK